MVGYEKYVDLIVNDVEIGSILFDRVEMVKHTERYVFSYKGHTLCRFKNHVVMHNLKFSFAGNDVNVELLQEAKTLVEELASAKFEIEISGCQE